MELNEEFGTLIARIAASGIVAMIVVALVLLPGWTGVHAQDASPVPIACTIEPVPPTFFADLVALPVPEVTATAVSGVPEGVEVIDGEIRTEVVGVVETLILCVNQGEVLRSFALFEPNYLRRIIDPEGLMSAEIAIEIGKSFATPEAIAEDQTTRLAGIVSIRQLTDGSVVVVFQTSGGVDRDADTIQTDLFVLREIDGSWLIVDGLSDIDRPS